MLQALPVMVREPSVRGLNMTDKLLQGPQRLRIAEICFVHLVWVVVVFKTLVSEKHPPLCDIREMMSSQGTRRGAKVKYEGRNGQ